MFFESTIRLWGVRWREVWGLDPYKEMITGIRLVVFSSAFGTAGHLHALCSGSVLGEPPSAHTSSMPSWLFRFCG